MKEIEVPKELKKELQKFNLYCRATTDDMKITWSYYYYKEDGGLDFSWSNMNELKYGGNIETYFDELIESFQNKYNDILDDETDCDGCTNNANLEISYSPVTSTFEIYTTIYTQDTHYYEHSKTFEDLSKQPRNWWNQNGARLYEKLNDDNFVQSLIDENDGETAFEMNFEGYGDSGSIEDGNYSANIENLGYEMLDLFAAGFENNEGGNGTIYFDLEDKEMNLEYNQNYEESFIGSSEEIRLV
jgi:hypothetical protein